MRSVFIEYDPYNRLGNRMFQYAFGYIVAKKFNCPLYSVEGLPNFGIKPNPPDINLNQERIYTRDIGDQYFDFDLLETFNGDLFINSWVQKTSYYINHREELRRIFGIRDLEMVNKDELIIHIRETDYKTVGVFLGYEFYKRLIDEQKFKSVKIVTDNPKGEAIIKLINDGCSLSTDGEATTFNHHGDKRAIADFKTLLYSENIAISQSSFAWWPAFLGDHKKVIFPYSCGP